MVLRIEVFLSKLLFFFVDYWYGKGTHTKYFNHSQLQTNEDMRRVERLFRLASTTSILIFSILNQLSLLKFSFHVQCRYEPSDIEYKRKNLDSMSNDNSKRSRQHVEIELEKFLLHVVVKHGQDYKRWEWAGTWAPFFLYEVSHTSLAHMFGSLPTTDWKAIRSVTCIENKGITTLGRIRLKIFDLTGSNY